ncbi:hypothetical protein WR25_06934 [Diploscapter pachys]|uniref:Alpha-1,6-mannosyl-glycoprotein 2-beta-N-acetylglucosaminyltransferase n=1 Tax=Diploscapter pachys TaxID=2018661 RepID=A0A2A2L4D9_9BILA|nr:hypothetical protein WR25_06934 [Diploscapter pachys]
MFHRRTHKLLNTVIGLCIVGVIVLFLKSPSVERRRPGPNYPFPSDPRPWPNGEPPEVRQANHVDPESGVLKQIPIPYDDSDLSGWNFKSSQNSSNQILGMDIVKSVNFLNLNFDILNVDKFGPLDNIQTVIVIQVHNRPVYLKYLIESLQKTKGIEKTLLVFSHDINVISIDEMIRNITFARVYQIYYPFNMQLFPHVFPGQDPRDCPEKIGKDGAHKLGCQNADHSDKYGNYRVAKLTQIKHHWWWKMNFVFDGIVDRLGLEKAWILLLEEDHFVAPDALHVLDYITQNKKNLCSVCDIISLGFYLKKTTKYGEDIAKLGAHPWYSSKHNMGMALQRDTWQMIKNCSEMFCTIDDYNWDWSVMQISTKCLPQRFRVIFAKSPRVLHIGDCGVHTHRCDAHNAYASARDLLQEHSGKLFPEKLDVTDVSRRSLKPSKENGGWGDKRDVELCRINTHPLDDYSKSQVLKNLLTSAVPLK